MWEDFVLDFLPIYSTRGILNPLLIIAGQWMLICHSHIAKENEAVRVLCTHQLRVFFTLPGPFEDGERTNGWVFEPDNTEQAYSRPTLDLVESSLTCRPPLYLSDNQFNCHKFYLGRLGIRTHLYKRLHPGEMKPLALGISPLRRARSFATNCANQLHGRPLIQQRLSSK